MVGLKNKKVPVIPIIQGPLDLNPKENQPKSKTNTNNNSDTNLKTTETLETSKNQPTAGPSKNNKNPDQPAQKTTNEVKFDEMKDQTNKTKKRNLTQTLSFESIEEFPIIGFYLYHVTSAGQSSNWTTSGK